MELLDRQRNDLKIAHARKKRRWANPRKRVIVRISPITHPLRAIEPSFSYRWLEGKPISRSFVARCIFRSSGCSVFKDVIHVDLGARRLRIGGGATYLPGARAFPLRIGGLRKVEIKTKDLNRKI